MTSHLTHLGHLTKNQKDEANLTNTMHMDFIQVVLQRIADEHKDMPSVPITIHCRKPYIVVGHGPDWKVEVEKIRGTKAKIIATDQCFIPMIEMGIIPDYIVTYEESPKNVNEKMFDLKAIREHGIEVIGSKLSRDWLGEKLGKPYRKFTDYPAEHISNVGIFGCIFAKKELGADKIIMIGMNCWSNTEAYPFLNWYVEWRWIIGSSNDYLFVNCTQGGIVYFHKIIIADFAKLEIVWD